MKNWTRNVDIFQKDFLIIPINKNAHWYLAIVCFPYLNEAVFENDKDSIISSDNGSSQMETEDADKNSNNSGSSDTEKDSSRVDKTSEIKTPSFYGENSRPKTVRGLKNFDFSLDDESADEADEENSNEAPFISKEQAQTCSKM